MKNDKSMTLEMSFKTANFFLKIKFQNTDLELFYRKLLALQ